MGEVYKGKWRSIVVAVKTNKTDNDRDLEKFRAEIRLMSQLRHPNIVMFLRANLEPNNTFFLTEFYEKGDLHNVLVKENPNWFQKVHFALDMARAMNYLHLNNPPILHRDLKSLNVLITKNYDAMIADFGISKVLSATHVTMTNAGTINWSAPELLVDENVTKAADVYSYGMVLWEILTGEFPFQGDMTITVLKKLKMGERPKIPPGTNKDFKRVVEKCWAELPADRPQFAEIITLLEKQESECSAQQKQNQFKKAIQRKQTTGDPNIKKFSTEVRTSTKPRTVDSRKMKTHHTHKKTETLSKATSGRTHHRTASLSKASSGHTRSRHRTSELKTNKGR
eukprot:TRINITY_DN12378_c0_g1_i1.p1 TRINITY_DN12378_c0_g1~~TRINITY_DN12378_c0_g1_i1.p1  ORF type:complete len:339 (+),score=56.23 TRINITY_DN12378_c0_g1_i1:419-1435(+)